MLHELSAHRLIKNNLHCKNIILHFCKSYSDLTVQLCFINITTRYDVIITINDASCFTCTETDMKYK
jgi:hypothetical protein